MPYVKERQVKHVTDEHVKQACIAYAKQGDYHYGYLFVDDLLAGIADVPRKVAEVKLFQCARRDLIEYGVSLRTCWWTGDRPERILYATL